MIYALSVFTHFTVAAATHWISEMCRVLKPGGVLMMSLHGDALLGRLNRAERCRLSRRPAGCARRRLARHESLRAAFHPRHLCEM